MKTPALLAIVGLATALALHAEPDLADLTVPLKDAPVAIVDSTLHWLLSGITPTPKTPPTVLIKEGQYILYGDLFKTHEIYALVQVPGPAAEKSSAPQGFAALALWHNDSWELRGLWKIPVTWRPEGRQSSDPDPLPDTPATQAFTLKDLDSDGTPEVIIAGPVGEYFQDLYLLRFSAKDKTLLPLATTREMPINAGRYVRLYDKSSGHPIWGTWKYFQWSGENLAPVAFWHDQVPFDGVGDSFLEATAFDKTGAAKKYHIVQTSESKQENTYTITRDGQPYATITFLWRKSPDDDSNTIPSYASVERAYLYRKLTGLALATYPSAEDEAFPVLFEKNGTVRVTGVPEAIKALSPRSK
ncbi:hypothetical protein BH09VER1_BH09VER1_37480 [soil metagenome]